LLFKTFRFFQIIVFGFRFAITANVPAMRSAGLKSGSFQSCTVVSQSFDFVLNLIIKTKAELWRDRGTDLAISLKPALRIGSVGNRFFIFLPMETRNQPF